MVKSILMIIGVFFLISILGAKFVQPPIDKELPASVQNYLRSLYDNINKLEKVSSVPDGSRDGGTGDMLLYISGTTYRLYINVDGSTLWKYVTLN